MNTQLAMECIKFTGDTTWILQMKPFVTKTSVKIQDHLRKDCQIRPESPENYEISPI